MGLSIDSLILEFRKIDQRQLNLLTKIPSLLSDLNSWAYNTNTDLVKANLDELNGFSRGEFSTLVVKITF